MFGHCWEGMPGGCNVLKKVQKKLKKHGYEYVILHKAKIPSQRWNDTVELFDTMLLGVSTVEEECSFTYLSIEIIVRKSWRLFRYWNTTDGCFFTNRTGV